MEFQKLNAPTLKELFIRELESMILSGKLAVGEKLPSERELASSMQVSRAVVNSGIIELEKKGFLVVRPRIGTFVEDYRRNGTIDTLIAIMKYNGGIVKRPEIRSVLEVRVVLDILTAELTIDHASDEQIASLSPYLEKLLLSSDNGEAAKWAFDFHHEMGFITGNTLLPLFFVSFQPLVCPLWARFCQRYGIHSLYDNTSTLYGFLQKRDKENAINFIRESIAKSIEGSREIYL